MDKSTNTFSLEILKKIKMIVLDPLEIVFFQGQIADRYYNIISGSVWVLV